MHAFVTSKLDRGNALLYDLPSTQIEKLQRIQNSAACLVRTKKFDHISLILRDLHWLTVNNRIIFKILLMIFKALRSLAPRYLSEILAPYRPPCNLRSSNANFLAVPRCRTKTYRERAFVDAACNLCNGLPATIRNTESLSVVKCKVETFSFHN